MIAESVSESAATTTIDEYVKLNIQYWKIAPTVDNLLFDDELAANETATILSQLERQTVQSKSLAGVLMNKERKSSDCSNSKSELVLQILNMEFENAAQYSIQLDRFRCAFAE